MSELALNDHEGDSFVCHLHGMRVPELVRREATSDSCCRSCMVKLLACGRGLPAAAGGWSVNHAKDRADRKLATDLEPWLELLSRPAVHADLASLAALAAADEHGATGTVEIVSWSASASLIRSPARQSSTIGALRRWPSPRSPTVRMTATISSTVGGSAGYCSPLFRGGRPRW